MLTICTDTLPQTGLAYLAFRLAFHDTLERIALAKQIGETGTGHFGYLTEVPFLRSVAPHVQLDLLAETWKKHFSHDLFHAHLVDESVVYAVCETAARIVDEETAVIPRYLKGGPRDVRLSIDSFLSSELRALHINLSNEGDFLLISQFEDMLPDEGFKLKRKFGIDEHGAEIMFEVLGRWHLSPRFLENLSGLLNPSELESVKHILNLP